MSYERYHYGSIDRFFGNSKDDYEPPDGPPPQGQTIEQINMRPVPKHPSLYKQDPKCSAGYITAIVPCEGPDCDPGEMEDDCIEDPIYQKMMASQKQAAPATASSVAAKTPVVPTTSGVSKTPIAPAKTSSTSRPAEEPITDVGGSLAKLRAMIEAKRAQLNGYNPNPYFRSWSWF